MLPKGIKQEYELARARALAAAQERKQAAFAAMPELARLERERMELAFSMGPGLRAAADKEMFRKECLLRREELLVQQGRMLADHGLPPDYLEPRFACLRCRDTGVCADGTLCPCARLKMADAAYASSGLQKNARFELFDESLYREEEQKRRSLKAKALCEAYAADLMVNGAPGLLLMGETGLGKTYLMDCIGRRAIENGRSVKKYTAYHMVNAVLRAVREREEGPDFTEPELLLLDDLGAEPMIPGITIESLFSAVNERQAAGKATVLATNLGRANLMEQYGERIFSRLFAQRSFNVIELKGRDLRI